MPRPVGRRPAYNAQGVGTCGRCGKVMYRTRGEAKDAKRIIHPGDKMHAYQCGDYWHYGHDEEWRRLVEHGQRWTPLPAPAIAQIAAMARATRGAAA